MEKTGNIYIEEVESDFKRIHKSIILNNNIDCLTLGIYTKILVLGKKWQLNIKGLSSYFGISDTKIRRSISLLEREGYISRKPIQDEATGKLSGWNYILHAKPLYPENRTNAGKKSVGSTEYPENRQHGYPTTRLSDNTENGEDNNNKLKKTYKLKDNLLNLNPHSRQAGEGADIVKKNNDDYYFSLGDKDDSEKEKVAPWRESFDEYMKLVKEGAAALKADANFRADIERLEPNVDYDKTIDSCVSKYWGTETGWEKKRRSRTKKIDMKATLRQNFDKNRIYKERQSSYSGVSRPRDVDTHNVNDVWADILAEQERNITGKN